MTIIVGTANGVAGNTTNATSAAPTASYTTSGNPNNALIVIVAAFSYAAATLSTLTANGTSLLVSGNTAFTFSREPSPGGNYPDIGIYFLTGLPDTATAYTVDASLTASTWVAAAVFIAEVSFPANFAFDAAAVAIVTNNTEPYFTSTVTPATDEDLIVAVFAGGSTTTPTWGNGFTQADSAAPTGTSCVWGYLQSTTNTAQGAEISSTDGNTGGVVVAFKNALAPILATVNNGAPISEGATGVPFTGTNLTGATVSLTQGSLTVPQTGVTISGGTSGTFDVVVETSAGQHLAFSDATYPTALEVTQSQGSSSVSITLTPPAGLIFKTLSAVNTTSAYRITALPDLTIGDQIEAAGNAEGTLAAPTGLSFNYDGTFQFASGSSPTTFYARAYIAADSAWTPWAEIVCTGLEQADGFD